MPYQTVWVEPEVFLEYKGVTIYHTYKGDDVDQGASEYWYTTDRCSDADQFDIRDLDVPVDDPANPVGDEIAREILRRAIDLGLLKPPEYL